MAVKVILLKTKMFVHPHKKLKWRPWLINYYQLHILLQIIIIIMEKWDHNGIYLKSKVDTTHHTSLKVVKLLKL